MCAISGSRPKSTSTLHLRAAHAAHVQARPASTAWRTFYTGVWRGASMPSRRATLCRYAAQSRRGAAARTRPAPWQSTHPPATRTRVSGARVPRCLLGNIMMYPAEAAHARRPARSGGTRRAVQRTFDVTARHLRPFAAAWAFVKRAQFLRAGHRLADRVLIRDRRRWFYTPFERGINSVTDRVFTESDFGGWEERAERARARQHRRGSVLTVTCCTHVVGRVPRLQLVTVTFCRRPRPLG